MDVENMDVFVERIRTILAAVHLSDTFSAAGLSTTKEEASASSLVFPFVLSGLVHTGIRHRRRLRSFLWCVGHHDFGGQQQPGNGTGILQR
ncbi:hypothetical protein BCF53_1216 [Reinekea marinisedimentorum]|uniref:Uncharacterized protein n=1 Tax=Reinekea marinisedimentorum TaxID=230495 RepID=A0A4R3HVG9_9GAMM|nr:hypothetical protein BCF53_1216 [Reinekea marinisedimentorum]